MALWKDVPGYSGRYQVSDEGGVRTVLKGGRTRTLKPWRNGRYLQVRLSNPRKSFSIHRLVLSTFVRLPQEGDVARHLNDVGTDNRLENLAWGTYEENSRDAIRNGGVKTADQAKSAKLSNQDVEEIWAGLRSGKSPGSLANQFGVSRRAIRNIQSGASWKSVRPTKLVPYGEVIKSRRLELGLRQADLAAEMGISTSYLCQVERGDHPPCTRERTEDLARILRMELAELLAAEVVTRGKATLRVINPQEAFTAALLNEHWESMDTEQHERLQEFLRDL